MSEQEDFPPVGEDWVNVALGDDLVSAVVQVSTAEDEWVEAPLDLAGLETFVARANEVLRVLRYNCAEWVYFRLPGQKLHVHRKPYINIEVRPQHGPTTLDRPVCGQATPEQEAVGWRLSGCTGEPEGRDLCGNCLKLWRRSVAALAPETPDA